MKKSIEIRSFRAEEGKSITIQENAIATLLKFARVAKFSQPSATFDFFFLFLFVFFPISPRVIVFILHNLVSSKDWYTIPQKNALLLTFDY